MFTQISIFNYKAMVTGAALKNLILEWLPQKIIQQMDTVDLTGITDQEPIPIITNVGHTVKKCEAVRKLLRLKATLKSYDRRNSKNHKTYSRNQISYNSWPRRKEKDWSERSKFNKNRSECKTQNDNCKIAGIESSEIERQKTTGECFRCILPGDRKSNHRVKDWITPIKLDNGLAAYPKDKESQKMKVAEMELSHELENKSDSSSGESDGSDSDEESDACCVEEQLHSEYLEGEEQNELVQEEEGNSCNSPPESEYQAILSLQVENQCFNTPILTGRPCSFLLIISSEDDLKIEMVDVTKYDLLPIITCIFIYFTSSATF